LYTVIDVETTGTVHKYGKITEIAIYVYNGKQITDSFVSLVNPEVDIPIAITRLTGITNEMVSGAPRFYEIARKIAEITTGRIFVAHNVNFDYKFIQEEYARLGYHFNRKKICTVQLARKLLPGLRSYSLGKLCDELGIPVEGRHRASGDAMATVLLLDRLLARNCEKSMIPQLGKTGNLF
jgi:DNA polymerase III subunit epsilon